MVNPEGACKINKAIVVSIYPDVCIKDGKPVPYDLYGLASDDIRHSPNVRYTRMFTLNEGSRLSTCYGDEPASAGVQSGVIKGMCRPVSDFADSVRVNGQRAVRHDTVFEMNCSGPDGASNCQGKLVYVQDQREAPADADADKKRRETLEKLKQHYGKPDFYNQLEGYDPNHAEWWKEMAGVQEHYRAFEPVFDSATRAYSESMRETLHQSVINLFEDGSALNNVTSNGSSGLYDWYIGMHRTAFYQNGAWNADFLSRGVMIALITPQSMTRNLDRLLAGNSNDPHAERAVEQVRERRKTRGLRVSKRPGESLELYDLIPIIPRL